MHVKFGFSRKEASQLTGLSLGQLDYLIEQNIVRPAKLGDYQRATVLYSRNQIIELKIIQMLRERKLSHKIIHSFIRLIRHKKYNFNLATRYMLTTSTETYQERKKKHNQMYKSYGETPPKYEDYAKFSKKVEEVIEEDGTKSLWYEVFTDEELLETMKDLVLRSKSFKIDFVEPMPEVENEIKQASLKHNIDFDNRPDLPKTA